MIADGLGRTIRYLRLSITQACGMRCVYCRPGVLPTPASESILSADEIVQIVRHLVRRHGLQKVRLTGGEPTARRDLSEIVRRLSREAGVEELSLTTNGLLLERLAQPLADAGLQRINVSLDSLDADRFERMTGVDGLARVLAGLEAAGRAGLRPIKTNTVVVRGQNDHELPALLAFAAEHDVEIRFIELMPMGPLASQWFDRYVPEAEMRERLDPHVAEWVDVPRDAGSAKRYHARLPSGRTARVGFITAMSCPFCDRCDRIRIGADGSYYPCLMDSPHGTLIDAVRPVFDAERFDAILRDGLTTKAAEHPAVGRGVMIQIGG